MGWNTGGHSLHYRMLQVAMDKVLSKKEMRKVVEAELKAVYEQLFINARNITTYNYDKWGEDLVSHTLQYFLNFPIEKQYTIVTSKSKKVSALERYLTSAMSLAIRSSTSPFYSKHRKHMESHRLLYQDYDYVNHLGTVEPSGSGDYWSNMTEALPQLIKDLHFYDRYLIQKHYMEQMTIKEISKITHITTYTLSRDIKKALVRLKEQLQKL